MLSSVPQADQSHVVGDATIPLRHITLANFFHECEIKFGDRKAVEFPEYNLSFTYKELIERSNYFSQSLLSNGLYKGDRIGIWAPNRPEWLICQIAAAKLGLILVNINPAYRKDELIYCIKKVGLKCLVFAKEFKSSKYTEIVKSILPELEFHKSTRLHFASFPTITTLIEMSDYPTNGILSFNSLCRKRPIDMTSRVKLISKNLNPQDAINIQFTSGTTGDPKGATLTSINIINNAIHCARAMELKETDVLCIPVPLYHCFGMVLGMLAACSVGAKMVFPSQGFEPKLCVEAIIAFSCTVIHGVPTMFSSMLQSFDKTDAKKLSLRTGIMAGSPCPEPLMRQVIETLGCDQITIAYGMTETSPVSFQTNVSDKIEDRLNTVGKIQPHCEVKLTDEKNCVVKTGEVGEICVKGYLVMKGYWDEEYNHETLYQGWIRTGDLGTLDNRGYCKIVGRIKEMIIRGGENVYPAEIEQFLLKMDGIHEAYVFGIPNQKFGEIVAAYIIPDLNIKLSKEDVWAYCKDQVAHFKVPSIIKFVSEIPLTVTGKAQKYKMAEQLQIENVHTKQH